MNMAGLKQQEIAEAVGAAWKTSGEVVTSTATGNLKALMDMRNVLQGGMPEAINMLPITSKIAAVMASSSETALRNNAENIAFSVAKAMDIMGLNTLDQMEKGAARMSQVVAAFQNRVSPEAIASTTYYARQSRYDMDDFMRWGIVPSMMLERAGGQGGQGGGSRGIGPSLAAVNRMAVIGTMTKKTAEWFASLGMLGEGRIQDLEHPAKRGSRTLPTATTMTQTMGLRDQKLWASNPFLAVWTDLVPTLQKKFGEGIVDDPAKMRAILATSGMTQMAMAQIMEWVTKPGNVLRDAANVGVLPDLKELPPALRAIAEKLEIRSGGGAMPYSEAYKQALKNDPELAFKAAEAQWKNLETVIGNELIPILIPALHDLATALHDLSQWGRDNPNLLHGLVIGFAGLSGALAFAGTVLTLAGAFKALKLVLYDLPAALRTGRAGAVLPPGGPGAPGVAAGGATAMNRGPVVLPGTAPNTVPGIGWGRALMTGFNVYSLYQMLADSKIGTPEYDPEKPYFKSVAGFATKGNEPAIGDRAVAAIGDFVKNTLTLGNLGWALGQINPLRIGAAQGEELPPHLRVTKEPPPIGDVQTTKEPPAPIGTDPLSVRFGTGLDLKALAALASGVPDLKTLGGPSAVPDLEALAPALVAVGDKAKAALADLDALGGSIDRDAQAAKSAVPAFDALGAAVGRLQMMVVQGMRGLPGAPADKPPHPSGEGSPAIRAASADHAIVKAIERQTAQLGAKLPAVVQMDGRVVAKLVADRIDAMAAVIPSDRDNFDAGQAVPPAGTGNYFT